MHQILSDIARVLLCAFSLLIMSGCAQVSEIKDVLFASEDVETHRTEEAIAKSPELRELDMLCSEIAKPKGFSLILKRRGFTEEPSIVHGFEYSIKEQEAMMFFESYFIDKGWEAESKRAGWRADTLTFVKDSYRVNVVFDMSFGKKMICGLHCGKVKK